MKKIVRRLVHNLHEPVNSLTHFFGAIGAFLGLFVLVILTWDQSPKMISLAIYGISMVVLYLSSGLFHGIKLPEGKRMWLNRLDHIAIFLLIAGTYTPIVYNLFPQPAHIVTLAIIWSLALAGALYKLLSPRIHGLINASVYPVLAWAGVVPAIFAYRIEPLAPVGGVVLLFVGGMIYMAGFLVYYGKRPDPWPSVFGHHEIWHLFVLAGSLFHFAFMLFYVVPA